MLKATFQFLALICISLNAVAEEYVIDLLPTSEPVEARVMELAISQEVTELATKMQEGLRKDPGWARDFLSNAKPGQPLPYHPKLGLTEAEYKQFLASANTTTLVEVGRIKLKAIELPDHSIKLTTDPHTSKIDGLIVKPDAQEVITPNGALTTFTKINNTNKASPTGRWSGHQWKANIETASRHLQVKLAIGKRTDFGDGIIYYDIEYASTSSYGDIYEILLFPVRASGDQK